MVLGKRGSLLPGGVNLQKIIPRALALGLWITRPVRFPYAARSLFGVCDHGYGFLLV